MPRLLNSVVTFKNIANNTVDRVSTLATGALCLPSLITSALLAPQRALIGIANTVVSTIMQQVNQLFNVVAQQISFIVNKITGKIIGILQQIQQLISDIKSTIELIDDLKKTLTKRSQDILDFVMNKQNCEAFAANFTKCLQAKIEQEFTRELQQELFNGGPLDGVVNKITDKLSEADASVENFIGNYTRQVDKASTQLSQINGLITDFTYSDTGLFNK